MIHTGIDHSSDGIDNEIDLSVLLSLDRAQADGEPDLIVELIDLYLDEGSERVASMSNLLAAGDNLSLVRGAHTLRGSSATMGAGRLALLCEAIEHIAKRGLLQDCAALIDEAEREFVRVRESLLSERSKRICETIPGVVFIAASHFQPAARR